MDPIPVARDLQDHRIRLQQGDYRVVAPSARKRGSRVVMSGALIVEKRGKDSLGNEIWTPVTSFAERHTDETDEALFTLLSGGAELEEEPF